jgi:hypothetical protein
MTLEDLLKAKREEILRVCAKYGARSVRFFWLRRTRQSR